MANQMDTQMRFLGLLLDRTNSRQIAWARSPKEIGFVHCLVAEELIVFEVRASGEKPGELVDPEMGVAGIVSKCRNVSYLWLEPTPGFADLLTLLRQAPCNEQRFTELRRRAQSAPVKALEAIQ